MITEDHVSFETAKLLKEKGFNEECYCFWQYDKANNKDDTDGISLLECIPINLSERNVYLSSCNSKIDYLFKDKLMSSGYSAPTLQMAMKWLRENYGIFCVLRQYVEKNMEDISYNWNVEGKSGISVGNGGGFRTYEQACEAAIKYCLENLI